MGGYFVLTLCVFLVDGVVGDTSGISLVSVTERHSVTLHTGVTKQQRDKMLWYFNDTLIALINGEPSKSCLYDGEGGIFSGRLNVDYETGSLTITNTRPEHAGRYEANFIQSKSSGTSHSLNRNSKCDSTKITRKMSNIGDTIKTFSVSVRASLSVPDKTNEELNKIGKDQEHDSSLLSGLMVGIAVAVVLLVCGALVTAGVIYYRRRSSKHAEEEKNKLEHLLKV
ncbi:uncharacterized protein LOC125263160 isoform X1 [Megalobrama amblycephala]|uniref:uncharacterized protein LOC125261180 isoform X1 n=1 Tax=Megalobrama amblycephala TaxID=75352 RepID=UPI002013FB5C|nr:uncharacterized protein LOC125261180 isoform X1 [Megalobrama amblycephala]XP_048038031.1 uncharacterized protein LOC125263160 isoform X1 [Megalobrama amblycephala]